ncbi:hypothetical protein ACFCX4_22085 [Kitasatospora sp. NPDC056327]|uniref:hypothetical protein n=1 Tax=Kitasatospora sp. NPDC056327 TaxID=3345785 RepID=UPI0035D80C56
MTTRLLASVATEARPGGRNEDFVLTGSDVTVLLDGAGLPDSLDTGCAHGVPWFVRTLGSALHHRATDRRTALRECLTEAIRDTARAHGPGCDLSSPFTPSATVVVARTDGGRPSGERPDGEGSDGEGSGDERSDGERLNGERSGDERFEWLVLADSTLALRLPGGVRTVSDHRVSDVTTPQRAALAAEVAHLAPAARAAVFARAQRRTMNTAQGYWVAAADPGAAGHALVGSVPLTEVRAAALLSDGAARSVDDFGVRSWPDLLRELEAHGPHHLIARTRELERSDPDCLRWPRGKCHDDATAVLLLPPADGAPGGTV